MQASPGRGISRGQGSNRRRGREGDRPVGPVRRLAERGFKRAATAGGAGRRVHRPGPHPPGGLIPICLVRGGERAGAAAPCAPREHPDYIYQRVVSPEAPIAPSPVTRSGQGGPSRQGKYDISPPRHPSPGSGPLHPGLPGRSNPPTPARPRRFGPLEGRSGPGCAPGNHRGALAVRRAPHPTITLRIHPGQGGVADSGAAGPGARATRERRTRHPGPPRPPSPLCRTRPTGRSPHRRPRRPLEPRPRGARHPGDACTPPHRCRRRPS